MRTFLKRFLAEDDDARIIQLAGILRFALIFLQGVILVKAGVDLVLVGQIELVFFLVNFLIFYLENGGRNAIISWVPSESGSIRVRLAASYTAMHFLGLVAAGIAVLYLSLPRAPGYVFLQGTGSLIYIGIIVLLSVPVSALTYNYQLTGRRSRILPWIGLSFALQLLAVVVPLLTGGGVHDAIFWLAMVVLGRWVFSLVDGVWFAEGAPSRRLVYLFLAFALPLIFHALNSGLMDYIDGWIVSGYFGEEMFAVYRYGARELPINALLIGGLLTGLVPRFRKSGDIDHETIRLETRRLITAILPINCVLLLVSPILYQLVYDEQFVLSARIFNIYALTLLSRVIIGQVYLYVNHKNWTLAISTLGEIIVNVVLSIILLNRIGILGIPFATVVAYALHKVFVVCYVKLRLKVRLDAFIPWKSYLIASVALVISFLLSEYIYF